MRRRKRRKINRINRIRSLRDLDFGRPDLEVSGETKRWIIIIVLFVVGLVALLSLLGSAGTLGVYFNNFLKILFGVSRWYLPLILVVVGYFLIRPFKYGFKTVNFLGLIFFILGFNGLIHIIFYQDDLFFAAKNGLGGGYVGVVLAWPLLKFTGFWVAVLISLAVAIIGFILLFEAYFFNLLEQRKARDEKEDGDPESLWAKLTGFVAQRKIGRIQDERDQAVDQDTEEEDEEEPIFSQSSVEVEQQGSRPVEAASEEEKAAADQLSLGIGKFKQTKIDLPLSLLDGKTTTPQAGDIKANKLIIQKTLENFGILAEMGEAQVGPTVTQYTLKPSSGVKLSRITSLEDNLALALAAHPIRIEAPIPGRALIGIEVPNQAKAIVPLNEILASDQFKNRKSNLTIALGKDVMGRPWLAGLDTMPHLLIAGATGSGKSVCINAIILSLLYQNGPGELKFIMVDPKRVELPVYDGIPHLLTPVITDVKKTINALRWSIKEMENRFDILSASHHRNIASYNRAESDQMPYIVIVIDELADLMAAAGPEVEAAVVRLSQMSRAVGIHLVLATQRPSVDVLTGLIKANITSRLAFSVSSLVDSRTILDMSGAEKLLGRGDMLYISAEISKPKRLQGAFASDKEIKRVITYLQERAEPDYIEAVVEKQTSPIGEFLPGQTDEDGDLLLPEAKEVIIRAKKASASLLQRRLRIGYARAARILDLLEAQGIIGPGEGAKPREILINNLPDDTIKDTSEATEDEEDEDYDEDEDEGNDER